VSLGPLDGPTADASCGLQVRPAGPGKPNWHLLLYITSDIPLFDIPLFDIPLFDIPLFDIPLFDIPLFDIPLFDIPLFDIPAFDIML
jgi:hypothetical protein